MADEETPGTSSPADSPIVETYASGAEVYKAVDLIEHAVAGEPITHVIMACFAIALGLQYPKITEDELFDGIRGLSQWACLYLSSIEGKDVPIQQGIPSKDLQRKLN